MDKAMLLMMLAQQAPRLLSLLKNRGYDSGLMSDSIHNYANLQEDHPDSIMSAAFSPEQLSELDYMPDLFSKTSNRFISDDYGQLNPNSSKDDLLDLYFRATQNEDNIESPAAALAAKMLMRNPEIGLSDTEVYRNNISLNDRINLQGAVYSDDHPDKSPFMTTNPEATIDALRGVVNGVNNSPRLAELMGTQQDLIGDDNLDEGLSNFYKRLQQRRLQK